MKLISPAVENSHFNARSRPFAVSIEDRIGPDLAAQLASRFGRKRKGRS